MKVSVQTDNLRLLREALKSQCNGVRFGSEFCERLLPECRILERAYDLSREAGKAFTYVTPRLTNAGVRTLKEHFTYLNEKGESADGSGPAVVVNDFGALNMLCHYPNLRPHLGRNLVLVPARSAWADGHIQSEEPTPENWIGRWVRELYATTSLNYHLTIDLYRRDGCEKVDVDWIPHILPALVSLVEQGLSLSLHLHLIPVTFTRKCHTARFLGEKSPETCSRPCMRRAFVLTNEAIREYEEEFGLELFLNGNTVYRIIQPTPEEITDLERIGVTELILTMNPITCIDTAEKIDTLISTQYSATVPYR